MRQKLRPLALGIVVICGVLWLALTIVLGNQQEPEYCRTFQQVSGGTKMIDTFRWTPVNLADEYKLNLYGASGSLVASRWIKAPATSIDLNMGDFATGPLFQWEMEALLSGRSICHTPRSPVMLKPGDPNPPPSQAVRVPNAEPVQGFFPSVTPWTPTDTLVWATVTP